MRKDGMRLLANVRRSINNRIHTATAKTYFDHIPLFTIDNILKSQGYWLIQEDGEPWSGFLCGENVNVTFDIGGVLGKVRNAVLVLSWYKMESGRYEIVAYVS
jgi:hypothetical protein